MLPALSAFAIVLLAGFILIARAGRKLRAGRRKTPPAKSAYLESLERGVEQRKEVTCPFYFGKNPESNVVIANAKHEYEACIFSHSNRFAIQALEGAMLKLNGDEIIADLLADGDALEIAGVRFTFRCN